MFLKKKKLQLMVKRSKMEWANILLFRCYHIPFQDTIN
uniref:Uncharacterized protein n=1 Tax=Medicago truncatula TaxID=3880 RepID=I3SQ96_MEDTR|nr:unknown [Medicago truncatula]